MDINKVTAVYFVGAGGIGMSALIRYFLAKGKRVGGYDKTPSDLTEELKKEGADIHYEDNVALIGEAFKSPDDTLVVYTPAVPESHTELTYFRAHGFEVMKRARVLGEITKSSRGLCVAGTHGKTTTSSMLAHLLKQSPVDCNAFLGGILKNYESNLMLSDTSDFTVIEADEFDRSFHWLTPYMAVITSADPDHLDIYGTAEAYRESFEKFTSLIRPDGCLLIKKGINVTPRLQEGVKKYTYSVTKIADFYAENIRICDGNITFDFVGPEIRIPDVELGVPVKVNIENGVAAMAIAWLNGVKPEDLKKGMATFAGPRRRFDFHLKTDQVVLIDDYAHHPQEISASLATALNYPHRKLWVVFQPHTYTRTKAFLDEFAEALSMADEVILANIYAARETDNLGISSQDIVDRIEAKGVKAHYIPSFDEIETFILENCIHGDLLITMGAGDIVKVGEKLLGN